MHFRDLSLLDRQRIRDYPQAVAARLQQFAQAHGGEVTGQFIDFVLVGPLATPTNIGHATEYSDIEIVFVMDRDFNQMVTLTGRLSFQAFNWAAKARGALPQLDTDRIFRSIFLPPRLLRDRRGGDRFPNAAWGFSLVDLIVFTDSDHFRQVRGV